MDCNCLNKDAPKNGPFLACFLFLISIFFPNWHPWIQYKRFLRRHFKIYGLFQCKKCWHILYFFALFYLFLTFSSPQAVRKDIFRFFLPKASLLGLGKVRVFKGRLIFQIFELGGGLYGSPSLFLVKKGFLSPLNFWHCYGVCITNIGH